MPGTDFDTDRWPRRAAFDYFRGFDKPYFNVCTRVDASALKPALAAAGGGFTLGCCFLALTIANALQPFRLRLAGGRVQLHDRIDGSTTVLRADDAFAFARLRHDLSFARFASAGAAAIEAARTLPPAFDPSADEPALIHFTTLPWVHFTSFSHARNWRREDAVPKIAFGRVDAGMLPLSVEVHHALVDGVDVGRFIERFEAALRDPAPLLAG